MSGLKKNLEKSIKEFIKKTMLWEKTSDEKVEAKKALDNAFDKMRSTLQNCLKNLEIDKALESYQLVLVCLEQLSNPSDPNATIFPNTVFLLSDLIIESGWFFIANKLEQKQEPSFQKIVSYILHAINKKRAFTYFCAEESNDNQFKEEYFKELFRVIDQFIKDINLYDIVYDGELFSLYGEICTLSLSIALLQMKQKKYHEVLSFLGVYKENAAKYSALGNSMPNEILEQHEKVKKTFSTYQEINRLQTILAELEKTRGRLGKLLADPKKWFVDFKELNQINTSLNELKATEKALKIQDKISELQKNIQPCLDKQEILLHESGEFVVEEFLANELFSIVSEEFLTEERLRDIHDVLNKLINDVIVEQEESKNSSAESTTSSLTVTTKDDATTNESLKLLNRPLPMLFDSSWPLGAPPNSHWRKIIQLLSTIIQLFPSLEGEVGGSINHTPFPNDLDVLLYNHDMAAVERFIGIIILHHGGLVIANYTKPNRRIIKINLQDTIIDFSLCSQKCSGDVTINTPWLSLRSLRRFYPYPEALAHIQKKELHTVSDPGQMIRHDPTLVLRFVHIMAKENYTLSFDLDAAIDQTFDDENLFFKISPDRLYREMKLLFFTGYAVKSLDILLQLKLFNSFFGRLNELCQEDYLLTLDMVKNIVQYSDNNVFSRNEYPVPPSLLYYAVHWFVFIKKEGLSQPSAPQINLERGIQEKWNPFIDHMNKSHLYHLESTIRQSRYTPGMWKKEPLKNNTAENTKPYLDGPERRDSSSCTTAQRY